MILEQIEVVGFRGLNRLVLPREQHNVLVGEHGWEKSCLLDEISPLIARQQNLYEFAPHEFYCPRLSRGKAD